MLAFLSPTLDPSHGEFTNSCTGRVWRVYRRLTGCSIKSYYYGPDSIHAEFEADSCSAILGLPTCARWIPDSNAFIKLLTHQAPPILGCWCLFGIVAASMSTADGAILAMGTVFSHNLMRQLEFVLPNLVTDGTLLNLARASTGALHSKNACILLDLTTFSIFFPSFLLNSTTHSYVHTHCGIFPLRTSRWSHRLPADCSL